ncbi:TIM barrel protein [Intestinirhabdus alba]|jgi:2-keto-myo-inositol isomerase|uniref:TIM barrel protein n=1 Tax=Intestinirhabdus alba TaxID=2899544 RepID=A0A6L6ILZ8_9ENTR|nr:TIM barrel protein [Intestinirhabdus alba]MTH47862.1 TIM barrel protein [Intestinirhabdus alba]
MAISLQRFCINRKIAPSLSIESFFRLVSELGLNKIELRNDMPGGKVTDGLSHQQVRELAGRYQIDILTINAVYPFNRRTRQVRDLTESLLEEARAIGARALVLCPLNDGSEIAPEETQSALQELAPLFARYGVQGLVEPLGFPQSSLRSADEAMTLIRQAHAPFKLLIDTFHHHLYPQADEALSRVDVNDIGLVHLSGVDDPRPREQLTDNERIMLTADDRLRTGEQVARLEARGYQGVYAFEPFAPQLASWSEAQIRREISQSIALIQQGCA